MRFWEAAELANGRCARSCFVLRKRRISWGNEAPFISSHCQLDRYIAWTKELWHLETSLVWVISQLWDWGCSLSLGTRLKHELCFQALANQPQRTYPSTEYAGKCCLISWIDIFMKLPARKTWKTQVLFQGEGECSCDSCDHDSFIHHSCIIHAINVCMLAMIEMVCIGFWSFSDS